MTLPRFAAGLRTLSHLRLAWRLLRAVRRWDPDLIHIFKPKGPSGLVGAVAWQMRLAIGVFGRRASSHCRRALIVVDEDDWEGPGGWNDDPRTSYSLMERRFFAWQERYGLSHADAWTVTSSCLRERAIEYGADPTRVFVLPNGISASSVPLVSGASISREVGGSLWYATENQPTALLYARFAGVRAERVAAIWAKVRTILPDARLTVLGRGLAGEEELLRPLPGIDVVGWVDPNVLPAMLAAADVAVVPWTDTPSNRARHSVKVLELMRSGLPVVAYAVGELASTVGEAGVLVEPGDEMGFARAVVALLRDRGRARRLGDAARKRVLEQFTWERLAETAAAAYQAAASAAEDQEGCAKSARRRATHKTNAE